MIQTTTLRKYINEVKAHFKVKPEINKAREQKVIFIKCQTIWKLLNQYRSIIITTSITLSIARTTLWYSLWGINILSFSSLQDIFNYTIETLIGFGLLIILFALSEFVNKVVKVILIVLLGFIICFLFDLHFSVVITMFSAYVLYISFILPKRIAFYIWMIFLVLITLQPIERYITYILSIKTHEERYNNQLVFAGKAAHYKQISFEYATIQINTNDEYKYYFIGSNTQYFFIYDVRNDVVMIIPISECSNLQSSRFALNKIFTKK